MFLIIILYALLALTFIFAKKALLYASPCFLIGFRMILAGVFLFAYCWLRDKNNVVLKKNDAWLFFKTAVFHIYIAFVFEFWAMQYVSALKTNLIYSLSPFIAAILSCLLLSERLTLRQICAILIGFCGMLPVLFSASTAAEYTMEFGNISLPEVVLFVAVFSSAYAWFLIKKLMNKGYHIGFINGAAMCIGGVLSLLTSFMFEGFVPLVSDWPLFLWWVFLLIMTANIIFYNLYAWLLKYYSVTFIAFAGFLSPIFGIFYEWCFMGGQVSWHYFVSVACISCGLCIFYKK